MLVFFLCRVESRADAAVPIVVQLKWDPEFQFAGYYTAFWYGYYREVGLDVKLIPRLTPKGKLLDVAEEVSSGRAQFGVSGPDILLQRDKGKDFVLVGTIFQKSPYAYFVKDDSPIKSFKDFSKARIATAKDFGLVELMAIAKQEGVLVGERNWVDYGFALAPLIQNRADVVLDYSASGLWASRQKKIPVREFKAKDFGVEFYGDLLYSTKSFVKQNPEVVDKFWKATIKGWQYALNHEVEIARRLSQLPRGFSYPDVLGYNLYEASAIRELMDYPLIPIGQTNQERWEKAHAYLKSLGLVSGKLDFNDFYFDYDEVLKQKKIGFRRILYAAILVISFVVAFILFVRYMRKHLKWRSQYKTTLLNENRLKQALFISGKTVFEWNEKNGLYIESGFNQIFNLNKDISIKTIDQFIELVYEKDKELLEDYFFKFKQIPFKEILSIDFRIKSINDELIWARLKLKKIKDDVEFSINHLVGLLEIISDIKIKEHRLLKLNKELEERIKERTRSFITLTDKLKISDDKIKSILESIPLGVAWKNKELEYIGCNKRFLFDLGFSDYHEIAGKKDQDIGWVDDVQAFAESDDVCLNGGFEALSEVKVYVKKTTAYFRVFKAPFKFDGGQDQGVLMVCEDITDHKNTENLNLDNLYLFKGILNASVDHISIFTYKGNQDSLLTANTAFIDWFKLSSLKSEDLSLKEIYDPKLSVLILKEDMNVMRNKTPSQFEVWMSKPNGEKKLFNIIKSPFYGNKTQVTGVLSIARDITDSHELASVSQIFFNNCSEPQVFLRGLDIIYANRAMLDFLRIDDIKNKTVSLASYFIDQSNMKIKEYLDQQAVSNNKGLNRFEWSFKSQDMKVISFEVIQKPVIYMNETLIMESWHNIDQHCKEVKQLEKNKEIAELAVENKSRFLANMSHEIRTPMSAILGFSQVALRKPLDELTKKYLVRINKAASSLLTILNDILDFSKLEANALKLRFEAVDIIQLVESVIDLFEERAKSKNLDLSLDISNNVPDTLNLDPIRIRQIISNILSNAIKFTHSGYVKVSLSFSNLKLTVIIADSGIGMSVDQLDSIFQAYQQADAAISHEFGGTGLGLVISRQLAQSMGGNLLVVSEMDNGSRFILEVPTQIAELSKPVTDFYSEKWMEFNDYQILVAEDNELNQELIEDILSEFKAKSTIVADGYQAVECLKINLFDLVLMDVKMPIMDGLEATKLIRTFNDSIPIVAMTANAFEEDRQKCLDAGMDDHITKPFKMHELQSKLEYWLKINKKQ